MVAVSQELVKGPKRHSLESRRSGRITEEVQQVKVLNIPPP
jgi:hypothetical protein